MEAQRLSRRTKLAILSNAEAPRDKVAGSMSCRTACLQSKASILFAFAWPCGRSDAFAASRWSSACARSPVLAFPASEAWAFVEPICATLAPARALQAGPSCLGRARGRLWQDPDLPGPRPGAAGSALRNLFLIDASSSRELRLWPAEWTEGVGGADGALHGRFGDFKQAAGHQRRIN